MAKQGASGSSWAVRDIIDELKRRAAGGFDLDSLRSGYFICAVADHAKDILNNNIKVTPKEIKNTLMALLEIVYNFQRAEMRAKGFDVPGKIVEDIIAPDQPDKKLRVDYTDAHGNAFDYEETVLSLRKRLKYLRDEAPKKLKNCIESEPTRFKYMAESTAITRTLRNYLAPRGEHKLLDDDLV